MNTISPFVGGVRREMSQKPPFSAFALRGQNPGPPRKPRPRELAAPLQLTELLSASSERIHGPNLIGEGRSYIQWYGWAHREWRAKSPSVGMSSKFHDLRASYCCERLEFLTGKKAPCAKRMGASPIVLPRHERLSDADARSLIAVEMGHNRIDVLASYCGRAT